MIFSRTRRQLEQVDWDFPVPLDTTLPPIHGYPGAFAPSLPAALIEALSRHDALVFDPYGGTGTAAIEALRLGRRAWNADLNPAAILASYVSASLVLLQQLSPTSLDSLFDATRLLIGGIQLSDDAGSLLILPQPETRGPSGALKEVIEPQPEDLLGSIILAPPNIVALRRWFEPLLASRIERLLQHILNSDLDDFTRIFAVAMLSSVLRALSSQTRSWAHIADNVFPADFTSKDLIQSCLRWLQRTHAAAKRVKAEPIGQSTTPRFRAEAIDWTANLDPSNSARADLLITSLPYAGAIDYVLAQRLSLYLFGFSDADVNELCRREIGARRKRFTRGHISVWADALVASLQRQLSFVGEDAFVCLVIPHQDGHRELGLHRIVSCLRELGWYKYFEADRSIRQSRTRHSWTSIKKETLQIYTR